MSGPEPLRHMLRDRIAPDVRVLLVGINPGIRSAAVGHHFAGYSNRFWRLLYESRLVPEPIRTEDDARLTEWGLGITNLIARPTPGIGTLRPEEYVAGTRRLRRKIRQSKPEVVALVGVTLFRAVFGKRSADPVELGLQVETLEDARVFVLPNPSGRNAHFSYREMLAAFERLRHHLSTAREPRTTTGPRANLRCRPGGPGAGSSRHR